MDTGYSIVAFIWTIASASYEVAGQRTSDKGPDGTPTDVFGDTPTTSFFTSTSPTVDQANISLDIFEDIIQTEADRECFIAGQQEFFSCLDQLGTNSMKHFVTKNVTEFLADLCSPDVSKPLVECLAKHFRACPVFLNTPQVQLLQFGPYDIKDIMYFSTVDHMCDCSLGLICVQKLNKLKSEPSFAKIILESPLVKIPNYKTMCDEKTGKFVDCTRKNLEKCKFALNQRFHEDFTLGHAEEVLRMFDFKREHCEIVNEAGFDKEYLCIEDLSRRRDYKLCLVDSQHKPPQEKMCGMRDCVHKSMGHICNSSMIDIYIDGINIYRHNKLRFLNFPCSSAVDVGFSILTVVVSIVIVVFY